MQLGVSLHSALHHVSWCCCDPGNRPWGREGNSDHQNKQWGFSIKLHSLGQCYSGLNSQRYSMYILNNSFIFYCLSETGSEQRFFSVTSCSSFFRGKTMVLKILSYIISPRSPRFSPGGSSRKSSEDIWKVRLPVTSRFLYSGAPFCV